MPFLREWRRVLITLPVSLSRADCECYAARRGATNKLANFGIYFRTSRGSDPAADPPEGSCEKDDHPCRAADDRPIRELTELQIAFVTLGVMAAVLLVGILVVLGSNSFVRYAPGGQDYAIARYTDAARRLLDVLEYRLEEAAYLAEEYSIADIACWPWTRGTSLIGIDLADFPATSRWHQAVAEPPAVVAATKGDEAASPDACRQKRAVLTPEQWSNLFDERLLFAARTRDVKP